MLDIVSKEFLFKELKKLLSFSYYHLFIICFVPNTMVGAVHIIFNFGNKNERKVFLKIPFR